MIVFEQHGNFFSTGLQDNTGLDVQNKKSCFSL